MLKLELEDQGHHVDSASNGWDGANLGLRNRYDVIILDLMIPGMNGRQVCRELRKNRIQTPVLIMSALDSQDEIEACLTAGARDYLKKPFLFDDFHKKILQIERDRGAPG